jgi:hypothetical protein
MNKIDKTILDYLDRANKIIEKKIRTDIISGEVAFMYVLDIAKMIQEQEDNEKYWKTYSR